MVTSAGEMTGAGHEKGCGDDLRHFDFRWGGGSVQGEGCAGRLETRLIPAGDRRSRGAAAAPLLQRGFQILKSPVNRTTHFNLWMRCRSKRRIRTIRLCRSPGRGFFFVAASNWFLDQIGMNVTMIESSKLADSFPTIEGRRSHAEPRRRGERKAEKKNRVLSICA